MTLSDILVAVIKGFSLGLASGLGFAYTLKFLRNLTLD